MLASRLLGYSGMERKLVAKRWKPDDHVPTNVYLDWRALETSSPLSGVFSSNESLDPDYRLRIGSVLISR